MSNVELLYVNSWIPFHYDYTRLSHTRPFTSKSHLVNSSTSLWSDWTISTAPIIIVPVEGGDKHFASSWKVTTFPLSRIQISIICVEDATVNFHHVTPQPIPCDRSSLWSLNSSLVILHPTWSFIPCDPLSHLISHPIWSLMPCDPTLFVIHHPMWTLIRFDPLPLGFPHPIIIVGVTLFMYI